MHQPFDFVNWYTDAKLWSHFKFKRHPITLRGAEIRRYKTASFQKEAMRAQVALWFFMKWSLYREVPLCLRNKTYLTHKLRKVYCWKIRKKWLDLIRKKWLDLIRKKWLDLIAFVYKGRDMSFVTYRPPNKHIGHFMGCEIIYCNLISHTVPWAVLFSLPGSVMGRETVYLCYDFSEVLQRWRTNPERGTLQQTS